MRPFVSVITLTYNQAPFLEQCLQGVQMQEGEFELEHIVVDDASSDETPAILEAYQSGHPASVRLVRHEVNVGANAGMAEAYGLATGEFVATCEGDDWWIAPDKIAVQVALLRKRPDLSMCFHDAAVCHEDKLQWPSIRPGCGPTIRDIGQLLEDNFAHTCTVMYRRIPNLEFPGWYARFSVGDWPNHAFHAARGGIGYINRPLAAYRIHRGGSWSALASSRRAEEICRMLEELDAHFLYRYSDRIQATIARIRADALVEAA